MIGEFKYFLENLELTPKMKEWLERLKSEMTKYKQPYIVSGFTDRQGKWSERFKFNGLREVEEWLKRSHHPEEFMRDVKVRGRNRLRNIDYDAVGFEHPGLIPPDQIWSGDIVTWGSDRVRWSRIIDTANDKRYGTSQAPITMYRAAIYGGGIRPGDWITPFKEYAEDHNRSQLNGKGHIYEEEIPEVDCLWGGNDANEWIYAPMEYSLSHKELVKQAIEQGYKVPYKIKKYYNLQ